MPPKESPTHNGGVTVSLVKCCSAKFSHTVYEQIMIFSASFLDCLFLHFLNFFSKVRITYYYSQVGFSPCASVFFLYFSLFFICFMCVYVFCIYFLYVFVCIYIYVCIFLCIYYFFRTFGKSALSPLSNLSDIPVLSSIYAYPLSFYGSMCVFRTCVLYGIAISVTLCFTITCPVYSITNIYQKLICS